MSARRAGVAVVAAAALAGAGAVAVASDGTSGAADAPAAGAGAEAAGGLAWVGRPSVFAPEGLPRDRVLTGVLRNDTAEPVDLRLDRVVVRDARGRALRSSVRFVQAFGHGLYGPGGPPAPLRASRYDQERLGERLSLAPGAERPVTVAWRVPAGRGGAVAVDISSWRLAVPRG